MVHDTQDMPIRVLIAEDDTRVRAALRVFLNAYPRIEVVAEADRAPESLTLARRHDPDVVLVDMFLPTKDDGLALVRALSGELGIPVLAMSMEAGVWESALKAGAARFMAKSTVPDELLPALESVGARIR